MNAAFIAGILLIVLGVTALAYQGITYSTHKEVIDVGPFQASTEKKKTIPLPPVLGITAIAGGIVLLVVGGRKS